MSNTFFSSSGHTSTIALTTAGFTARYHSIGEVTITVPDIKTSNLATSTAESYIPGDLLEGGETECEFEWPKGSPPPVGVTDTFTITTPTGGSTTGTLAGSGYLKSLTYPKLMNNTLMVGKYKIKWNGVPTYTAWT